MPLQSFGSSVAFPPAVLGEAGATVAAGVAAFVFEEGADWFCATTVLEGAAAGVDTGAAGVGEKIKSSAPAAVGSAAFGSPLTAIVRLRTRQKEQGATRKILGIGYCGTLPLPFNWNVRAHERLSQPSA